MDINNSNNIIKEEEDSLVEIKYFLQQCLHNWKWFVFSIFVAILFSLYYIKKTSPTYLRTASVLIKEDKKGSNISSDVSELSNIGLFSSTTNVNNEIVSFRSPILVQGVVKRLKLNTQYFKKGFLRNNALYGTSLPINVDFIDLLADESSEMELTLLPNNKVTLTNFINSKKEKIEAEIIDGTLGDTLNTPIGRLVISPTSNYSLKNNNDLIIVKKFKDANVVSSLLRRINVSLNEKKTTIIDLSIEDVSVQRAEDILNTLISVYNEDWITDKNKIAVSTSMFINDRLAVIEGDLGNVDNSISTFKSKTLVPDLKAASNMYMEQSNEAATQLQLLNNHLYMARYILTHVNNNSANNQLIPANSGIENSAIEAQITKYNESQLRRNNLVANSSEQNPLVIDLDQSLNAMRGAIISSIENYIVVLQSQISEFQKIERQTKSRIAENPTQAKYLLSVERQQKVKEALYLFLLQKREENELSQAFTPYNTRVIKPPYGGNMPVAPKKLIILLAALLFGALLPAAIIFIKDSLNTTLRGKKDVENLPMPFLGEIPYSNKKDNVTNLKNKVKKDSLSIVVDYSKRDNVNEAFRLLRTNFEFMFGAKSHSNVVAITSFNPNSGKSFISINLAISLAIKKYKVLVIDGDLRRASTSAYVNYPKRGLSNYLSGLENNINDLIIKDSTYENLSILPVGPFPPNPTELIGNNRFANLLDSIKSEYNFILIDCPPIDIVADTIIIEKLVDRTLFVLRVGVLERSMLSRLQAFYNDNRFKNMSIVLNGSNKVYGKYGYGYGYDYGHGYYRE